MPVHQGNVTVPKIRVVVVIALQTVWCEYISKRIIMLKAYFIYYYQSVNQSINLLLRDAMLA